MPNNFFDKLNHLVKAHLNDIISPIDEQISKSRKKALARQDIRGEELVWIEDKILQFKIPNLQPGEYTVTIHDDKGPPGDPVYSFLETTAYLAFPPVWPFVMRPNQTAVKLRVLPAQ